MQAHKTSAGVQEQACGALKNLAVNPDNQVAVAAAGGIVAIVAAMQAHKGSAGVQEMAGRALRNLAANNDNNEDAISVAGGIEVLATSMKTHRPPRQPGRGIGGRRDRSPRDGDGDAPSPRPPAAGRVLGAVQPRSPTRA